MYSFHTKIWVYPGPAAWHFASVPKTISAKIQKKFGMKTRGWGSLPVEVSLGKSKWETSIFPDKRSGTFLLPLKAAIRKAEELYEEDKIKIKIIIKP